MTEEEKTIETEETNDAVDVNVALLMAENKMLKERDAQKDIIIGELTKKLEQAIDLIEADSRAALVADISPKTAVPASVLSLMSVEDLETMKKVLDNAKIPAFKAGTPLKSADKSPEAGLYNMFDSFMEKHRK